MTESLKHLAPVSGLMPVKNAMPYLRQTLASMAAQTYPAFRLIAWDNHSTDGSAQELSRWIPSRIPGQVITDQPLDLGRCRAALVERADTELCAWFDADDLYAPNRLEIQVQAIQAQPDAAVVGASIQIINQDGNPTGEIRQSETSDADIRWGLRFGNPIAQPTVLFRRSNVLAAGNYPNRNGDEDYAMWLRLSRSHRLINLDQVLVDYRVHSQNITRTFEKNLQGHRRDRQAELHDDLFPGFGQEKTIQLYDSLCPHRNQPIKRIDLKRLDQAAQCLADEMKIPVQAIKQTPLFREQRINLLTRYLKNRPLIRHAWPVLQHIKRLTQTPSLKKHAGDPSCPHV